LGLFTASDLGIPTSRDIATDNTTTAITADGLINALYGLKEGYQRNARWLFHRDVVKAIRKLKDGDGQYLWAPGIALNQPDTILAKPFLMSEYAPNTFTTGKYVGIVGDFSYYWIADDLNIEIQRLVELYAATNQIGFVCRYAGDGMPVLGEAFARVTLA
jgi:HK97 family phage major capsid protein